MDQDLLPPLEQGERHTLVAEEELRLEISFAKASTCTITLRQGSCELYGVELATNKPFTLHDGGVKLALFTWHGCVVDVVSSHNNIEISYVSDETAGNIAYVNTHAQLEALRDEAQQSPAKNGPRVLIVGPPESGKSSLCKTLIAYAVKLGRVPLWIDLDPHDNALSVPGTLSVVPTNKDTITLENYATTGVPPSTTAPLVLWHGHHPASSSSSSSAAPPIQPDLFRAQVTALGHKINHRLEHDEWARSSGCVVNTYGWIQDDGYQLLVHAVTALQITVVLVMGHDRLYSMLKKDAGGMAKVIKVPRSGGVVSRNAQFMRQCQSRALKRYFYGGLVDSPTTSNNSTAPNKIPQLTPFLLQISIAKITVYQCTSMALSAALLPVAAAQTTERVQLNALPVTEQLQHAVLAVCHPAAVERYEQSGRASDLMASGICGVVAVERVLVDKDMLHLLSPCTGSLPSHTLLWGDITWME